MADQGANRVGLRFRPGRGCEAILLLREGVFAIPVLDRPSDTRLVGSLDVYVHTVLTRPHQTGARPGGVFGEARRYGQQIDTLRFCINELMPLLRESRRSPPPVRR